MSFLKTKCLSISQLTNYTFLCPLFNQFLKESICSFRSKLFPLKADPILEGQHRSGKQTDVRKKRKKKVKL